MRILHSVSFHKDNNNKRWMLDMIVRWFEDLVSNFYMYMYMWSKTFIKIPYLWGLIMFKVTSKVLKKPKEVFQGPSIPLRRKICHNTLNFFFFLCELRTYLASFHSHRTKWIIWEFNTSFSSTFRKQWMEAWMTTNDKITRGFLFCMN